MANYPRWDTSSGPVKCVSCKDLIPPGCDIWLKSKGVYYCPGCGVAKEATGDEIKAGGIEEALIRDLGQFLDEAAGTTLAVQARLLARQLDDGEVAPREATQYTKEIRLNLFSLSEMYRRAEDGDDTEDRQHRFEERRRRENGSGI